MKKTSIAIITLAALLAPLPLLAQSVRELIPTSAPAGAHVFVNGRGLADPAISVAFSGAGGNAAVVERNDRYIEVIVPWNAASGNVRVANGGNVIAEKAFTLANRPAYKVSTIAGGPRSQNDPLKHPQSAAVVLPDGRIAVADEQHHEIKLITPAGGVSVLAGANKQGFEDGTGAAAKFKDPRGIAWDAQRGVLFVSDSGNNAIRQVSLDGKVRTIATQFKDPRGLTMGPDGVIYVCDSKNHRIRRVTADGSVTTFAGSGDRGDKLNDGSLAQATFNEPRAIVADGNVFWVADTKNNAIRKIADGQVTTLISFPRNGDDDDPSDSADGNPKVLNRPNGVVVDESGALIVSDTENDFIRRIDPRANPVTIETIAGTGKNGWLDGDALTAQFKDALGIAIAGAIYVADEDNDALRSLCPEVRVTGLYVPNGALAAGTEVRVFGTGFVPGVTTVKFGSAPATDLKWISSTTLSVKLPQAITGGSVAVTVTSCSGSAGPGTFVVDNTAPSLEILNGGAALADNALFNVPVTPVLRATDDFDPAPAITATLNGAPFTSGTTVTADGAYTLIATAEDAAGNRRQETRHFIIDTTAPTVQVLESGQPFVAGTLFNRAVVFDLKATDVTTTTSEAFIDGNKYDLKTPYSVDGPHTFTAKVRDALLNERPVGPLAFEIDVVGPVLTFTSHTSGQVLTTRDVTVKGGSDDAVTVKVNGVDAVVDETAKTFTVTLSLLEGQNTLTAQGTDRAGNTGNATLKLVLDTRAPELAITAPATGACVQDNSIEVKGTVSDPNVDKIAVTLDGAATQATLDAAKRTWTANVALGADGKKSILVEAGDTTGHTTTKQLTLTVDRTDPVIEITESGAPFAATLVAHPVTLFFRAADADANATLTATLGGAPFASGTEVSEEKTHTLTVTAKDCAGNTKTETRTFTIDLTPPRFLSFNPASGSKVSQVPDALSGTVDADTVEVRIAGRVGVAVTGGAFTLSNAGFADGVNELTLEAVDRAGNVGRSSYTLGIRTTKPLVDVVEGGDSMAENTVYNRPVAPLVRVFEQGVTFTATLDGAAFNNDRTVSDNGAHVLVATATDSAYGQTNAITRHFTIDRSAPAVKITSPANNAAFDADRVNVTATAEDSVSVSINGIAAVKNADNSWTAAGVPLDLGENAIVASGRDAAGNTAHDQIAVTRNMPGPAIVLTFPSNPYTTNHPRLDVLGRVLHPSTVAVTVPPASAVSVAPDPAGVFKVTGATLREGSTTITATATDANGKSTTVTASVTADFTPPRVRILQAGAVFGDGTNFATQAVLTADALDSGAAIPFTFVVDGNTVTTLPLTVSAAGGHTAVVTARDAAGNESRLERTFTIGTTAGSGCRLEGFDPADQSIIAGQKVELIGRSGGAAGVKVNGIAAKMANGSFCASVELPAEGPNPVRIVCTDAAGAETGDPITISLIRVTNDPSVTINSPDEDSVSANELITVTGTLGNGATAVDVNGTPATITSSNWSAANVRLRDGVNILVARASTPGGRTAIASRRVTFIQNPPSIAISSPVNGFITGTATVDVSGTWSNVDPSSLAVTGLAGAVVPTPWSDTTGRFLARNVPLTNGDNIIIVTGRDRTGRQASAQVTVKYAGGNPAITINDPIDNQYFPASAGTTFRVSGSYVAGEGAAVDVGGVAATQDAAAKTFTSDVTFATISGGLTPVVARVSEPGGGGAFDVVRVFKLGAAPTVTETFPAKDAVEVDRGVVLLVLFSNPMDGSTLTNAFRLENAAGTAINGKSYLDKDVLTFAPATLLTPGERYTIRVGTGAKDLAGQALAAEFSSSFTVASTAPAAAPTLTTASGRFCGQLIDVAGTTAPSSRVRLDYGAVFYVTQANAAGAFTYKVPLSGQGGYHVIRVRSVGADGTLSPFVELKINLDCTGPKVLSSGYDRDVNKLTIVFSADMKAETLTTGATGSVQLELDDARVVGGTVAVNGANAVVTPAEDLTRKTFTLKISTAVTDTQGRKLDFPYTNLFAFGDDTPPPSDGKGYITGEVYDATTGRPLANADVAIGDPAVTMHTEARGRYGDRFPEGAHTIRASADGYTTVWRQIIVPAGAGVIPIDIRLTRRGDTKTMSSGALTLSHGTTNAVTRHADLTIPAGAINSGVSVTLTSIGAQSLAGLLPLGWSPLASAEIVSTASSLGASQLTFDVPQSEITAAAQVLTAVRYDSSRDEWRVITPAVNVSGNKAAFDVSAPGAYALVYSDRRTGLTQPQTPTTGATLQGVADRCADGSCPAMVAKDFPLLPETVLPTESTIATLKIDGATPQLFPSGTAVQAYIEEELHLADGGRELGFPFATDLLLYRDLAGNLGIAAFNLAPSERATKVFLEVGFEHLRILPYPGRLDRGTLVGPEGGRVPGDDKITVEIPTGATPEALRATTASITDTTSFGSIPGYRIVGAFQLTLQRAASTTSADNDGDGQLDPVPPVELTIPASATFTVDASKLPPLAPSQLILVELLDPTPFGNRVFRLATEMTALDASRWTTKPIDRNRLPIDGVIREGRYLLLAAEQPIGYAKGLVRIGSTGVAAANARVTATGLGVADLTRTTGIFSVPVQATPATGFSLVPRTVALGDGNAFNKTPAPAPNEVVDAGELLLVAQPPHVSSTIPSNNGTDVSLSTTVEARLDPGIDPSSVNASTIVVIDTATGKSVTGTVSAIGNNGVLWKLPAGEALSAGTRYVATVSPALRGINGTPLGQSYAFSFTTATTFTNSEIHPEKIKITIPDANGVTRITGAAGALPANWLAVPVRRTRDFLTRYSAAAANDGSFSITVDHDPVAITDEIDLRVLNVNGALSAIIPLTPFVAENGRAFVAPAGRAVTFTSNDGIAVSVPAGAFDAATMVEMVPAPQSVFDVVPNINNELIPAASVTLTFEGRAKVPLELTFPAPGASGGYFLGILEESVRGPRIMAVDTLTAVNGTLTTARQSTSGARTLKPTSGGARNDDPKDFLLRVIEHGSYAAYQMKLKANSNGLVFAFMDGLTQNVDLFWDTMYSLYCGHRYVAEAKGRIAFPVPADTRFTVEGVDPATSLSSFKATYDPIPLGDPGKGVIIANPATDFNGPHPVFGSPFRVELAEVPPAGVTLQSIRDLELVPGTTGTLEVRATSGSSLTSLTKVSVLDVNNGEHRGPQTLPVSLSAKPGDKIVIMIDETNVDPLAPLSIVFNEAIDVGGATAEKDVDTELKKLIKFEQVVPGGGTPIDLLKQALVRLDSNGRRITILMPSALAAGEKFKLTLDKSIQDRSGNGLQLGQAGEKAAGGGGITPIGPSPASMELVFETRKPKGRIGDFSIRQGSAAQFGAIREMSSYGNLLFIAAVDGGILAYDTSNPAKLDDSASPLPFALAPGRDSATGDAVTDYWSVQVDHHGRVYAAGRTNLFGVLRSFRVEDFITAGTTLPGGCLDTVKNTVCKQVASTILSQNIGTAYGYGLGSAFVTMDRVEAIPRKVRIVVGDAKPEDYKRDDFVSAFAAGASSCVSGAPVCSPNEIHKFTAKLPATTTQYRIQRVTVENVTLGLKWSADARAVTDDPALPKAEVKNIIAGPNDTLRVTYNQSTYGVVTLFGYGIGVFDLNAMESNDSVQAKGTVSADRPQEQVALRANAFDDPSAAGSTSIGDLAYSPESEIMQGAGNSQRVYALDTRKGVSDFVVTPPSSINRSGELILTGGANARFEALKSAIIAAGNSFPLARFNTADLYHDPNKNKDFLLMPALDFGLLVVEAGAVPLNSDSFADVVWLPNGAHAVRVIGGTNMAVVIDAVGFASLIDLSRLDERVVNGTPTSGLFPTAAAALSGSSGIGGYGAPDPRILWRSATPVGQGQVAPVIDPETGFLFGADFLAQRVHVQSALEPKVRFVVNTGAASLKDVTGIVPLGIAPPAGVLSCDLVSDPDCGASLGVFRVEAKLPGSIVESLPATGFQIALESELVPGADTPQTPEPYPVAHLRFKRRDGNVDARSQSSFTLHRAVDIPSLPELRFQKGYNRYVSDWIVAIADPRAAKDYSWGGTTAAEKETLGCFSCERPKFVKDDPSAKELYTAGRFITVRPEDISSSSPYAWLSENQRLRARASTVMADVVRPTNVLIAAQNPPVAGGMFQETTYLHSGEVGHDAVDLDAGGRAGWNVVVDRSYRSRSLGFTPLGIGWDSGIFKRLRVLPSGDVEYRDGSGEVFLYRRAGSEYTSPKGYFARLARYDGGWVLTDQKLRVSYFDDYGRIVREGDEFYTPDGKGNQIVYIYDAKGRLDAIIDPNERTNRLRYFEGLSALQKEGFLKEVEDWRSPSRKLTYDYDTQGRLTNVFLPEFRALLGTLTKPERRYAYDTGTAGNYSDKLELSSNLVSVIEPDRAPYNGPARVTFAYNAVRDFVKSQKWATGEEATFNFSDQNNPSTTDVLGQERRYTFKKPAAPAATEKYKWYTQDRTHILKAEELQVEVYKDANFGALPATLAADAANTEPKTRTFDFTYDDEGQVETATLAGVSTTQSTYTSAGTNLGKLISCTAVGTAGSSPCASGATVKTTYNYSGTYLQSTTANGQTVESPEAHRGTPQITATNSNITSTTKYDLKTGLVTDVTTSGGTAGDPTNSKLVIDYPSTPPSDLYKRGLPERMHIGTSALTTTFTYLSQDKDFVDDGRNSTTTTYDEWHRPLQVKVTNNAGDPLTVEKSYVYDPSGRLHEQRDRQTTALGDQTVTTTYDYDSMGRLTSVQTDKVDINGTSSPITQTTSYSQYAAPQRKVVTTPPGGSEITTTLDTLGRTKETRQSYDPGKFLVTTTAYDLAGNTVYTTDQKEAAAFAFDPASRMTDALGLDGTKQKMEYDGWGRTTNLWLLDATGNEYYRKHTDFTAAGKVEKVTETGSGFSRDIAQQWDAAGRPVHVATTASAATDGGRAMFLKFDDAGRLLETKSGKGTIGAMATIYEQGIRSLYGATGLAKRIEQSEPKSPAPSTYQIEREFDTLGNAKFVKVAALQWQAQFDQRGSALKTTLPGRPTTTYEYDSRGQLIRQTLPDGSVKNHQHNETGAKVLRVDEQSENTKTTSDQTGRPKLMIYADNTTEEYVYDGPRLLAMKNRQGMWESFEYNAKAQLLRVYAASAPIAGATILDELTYDDAGRLKSWRTKDVLLEYSDYTGDSLPKTTKQTRFKGGSGFSSPIVLDSYTVSRDFNGYGELTDLTMPGSPVGEWVKKIHLNYDSMGNVIELQRDGEELLTGEFRNAHRPDSRTVHIKPQGCATASCLKQLLRTYGYKPSTSQLESMVAQIGGIEIAGSKLKYDDTLQVTEEELAGVSGGAARHTRYSYDTRGRLFGSVTAVSDNTTPPVPAVPGVASAGAPGVQQDLMSPADFRTAQERTPAFDAAARNELKKSGIDPDTIDPPGSTADPQPGHKIAKFTKGPTVEDFKWTKPDGTGDGDVRTEDGRFRYSYDEKHRLIWVAEKVLSTATPVRRVLYSYDGNNRLIGRTAQYATLPTLSTPYDTLSWATEDRPTIIAADGVPPEMTFVWDSVTDRLLSIFKAGASASPSDPNGNLLRQFVHGDLGLDDPIEITSPDLISVVPPGGAIPVTHVYPVYDEAGNGTLQVVLNRNGEVVSRHVSTDPYGAEEFELAGAAIDQVEVIAKKTTAGALERVRVRMRATEALRETTIATGTRLAVVNASGGTVALSPVSATAVANDPFRVEWTLTGSQWNALVSTSGATLLSVAATSQLRAGVWAGDVPVLPAPAWASATQPVFSSGSLPVEVRDSIGSLAAFISAIPNNSESTTTPYEVASLGSLGTSGGNGDADLLMAASFHAQPFSDPFSGKNYVRARWFDPITGTWLTPDPMGYADSSNLYAFAGGDPINGRDATGLLDPSVREDFRIKEQEERERQHAEWCRKNPGPCRKAEIRGEGIVKAVGGGLQVVGGVTVGASTGPLPEPVTKTIACVNIVRGVENCVTGIVQAITGEERETASAHGLKKVLKANGVEPKRAQKITNRTEATVDVVSGLLAGGAQSYNAWRTAVTETALIEAVQADAVALRAMPKSVRGPVVARAFDAETGRISGAWTNVQALPDDLDPVLMKKLAELPEGLHFSDPGTHAEVLAVDELLKARRAAGLPVNEDTLRKLVTYQEWLNPPYAPAKMCPNCSNTLPTTRSIPGKLQ